MKRNKAIGFATGLTFACLTLGLAFVAVTFSVENGLRSGFSKVLSADLVDVSESKNGRVLTGVNSLDLRDLSNAARSIESVAAYTDVTSDVDAWFLGTDPAVKVSPVLVTKSFFSTLGIRPIVGYDFTSEYEPQVMLSWHVWRSVFGADPSIVDRSILLNGTPYRVAGVIARNADFPVGAEIWIVAPLLSPGYTRYRQNYSFHGLVRLRPGVPLAKAQAEFSLISRSLQKRYPSSNAHVSFVARPLFGALFHRFLSVIRIAIALGTGLLLMVWWNYITVLAVRISRRGADFAVRQALGAMRWRLIAQSACSTAVEVAVSVILSIVVCTWILPLLSASSLSTILPPYMELVLDWRDIAAVSGLLIAGSVIIAALLTLRCTKELTGALRGASESRATAGRKVVLLLRVLFGGQIAVTASIMVCALLFANDLRTLESWKFGMNINPVWAFDLVLPKEGAGYAETQVETLLNAWHQSLIAIPGVAQVAASSESAFTSEYNYKVRIPRSEENIVVAVKGVTPTFFNVFGIPILRGRTFAPDEMKGTSMSCIVDMQTARAIWNRDSVVGKVLTIDNTPLRVVGVVGSIDLFGKQETSVYLPLQSLLAQQLSMLSLHMFLKETINVPEEEVGGAVHSVFSGALITRPTPLSSQFSGFLLPLRIGAGVGGPLALVTLVLALVGTFSLVSFIWSVKAGEIALRVVFGATTRDIRHQMLRFLLWPMIFGFCVSYIVILFSSRFLSVALQYPRGSTFGPICIGIVLLSGSTLLASGIPFLTIKESDIIKKIQCI